MELELQLENRFPGDLLCQEVSLSLYYTEPSPAKPKPPLAERRSVKRTPSLMSNVSSATTSTQLSNEEEGASPPNSLLEAVPASYVPCSDLSAGQTAAASDDSQRLVIVEEVDVKQGRTSSSGFQGQNAYSSTIVERS